MTLTGFAMGTPAYMAPEQVLGSRSLDARADVWSLGVILYRVLSGALPFEGTPHSALFVKIVTADPRPLRDAEPAVGSALADVVDRCLRKAPADRFADASELARALRRVASQPPAADDDRAAAPASSIVSRSPAAAAAVAAVAPALLPARIPALPATAAPAKIPTVVPALVQVVIPSLVPIAPPVAAVPAAERSAIVVATLPPPPRPMSSLRARISLLPSQARRSPRRATAAPLPATGGHGAIDGIFDRSPGLTVSHVVGVSSLLLLTVVAEALLAMANRDEPGWPCAAFWLDVVWSLPGLLAHGVVLGVVAVGVLVLLRALNRQGGRAYGHLLAGAALVALGLVTSVSDTRGLPAAHAGVVGVVALVLAAVPVGLAADGFRAAVADWNRDDPGARMRAAVISSAVGAALFVALQILRGA